MLHTLRFSLQNAVYFIMLPFLVPVLFTFYIQGELKFKCKIRVPKGWKTTILSWLRGYFVGTSIFVGTSVPSRNTSSSEDISRARCTKRNQGQRWIWNRTSGKKWQQFLPTCCNEWCRTSRNAWGNALTTRDATSQTLYSGSEYCN